jgi:hypothetical protein
MAESRKSPEAGEESSLVPVETSRLCSAMGHRPNARRCHSPILICRLLRSRISPAEEAICLCLTSCFWLVLQHENSGSWAWHMCRYGIILMIYISSCPLSALLIYLQRTPSFIILNIKLRDKLLTCSQWIAVARTSKRASLQAQALSEWITRNIPILIESCHLLPQIAGCASLANIYSFAYC